MAADEVVAEAIHLAPVYYDLLILENGTIAPSISRIAPNYHSLIRMICMYQINYVNFHVFILKCEFVCPHFDLYHFVFVLICDW